MNPVAHTNIDCPMNDWELIIPSPTAPLREEPSLEPFELYGVAEAIRRMPHDQPLEPSPPPQIRELRERYESRVPSVAPLESPFVLDWLEGVSPPSIRSIEAQPYTYSVLPPRTWDDYPSWQNAICERYEGEYRKFCDELQHYTDQKKTCAHNFFKWAAYNTWKDDRGPHSNPRAQLPGLPHVSEDQKVLAKAFMREQVIMEEALSQWGEVRRREDELASKDAELAAKDAELHRARDRVTELEVELNRIKLGEMGIGEV